MSTPGRPQFSRQQATEVALSLFDVQATARELPSDSDQNFRLSRRGAPALLLKISNAHTPIEVLDLQNSVLAKLAAGRLAPIIPTLLPTLAGNPMGHAPGHGPYIVRLLTYLPGRPIAEIDDPPKTLLSELGSILGKVDRTLAEFRHPADGRYLQWDSRHADKVITENSEFVDREHRGLLRALVTAATERLRLDTLRQSVIHNDANNYNILVTGDGDGAKISGLIDFGDIVRSYTIAELANCAAYLMLDKRDPVATAAHIARGYNVAYPMDENERQSLFDLIVLRLCMSAAIGARRTRQDPANEYLTVSQRPVWALLSRFGNEDYSTNAARLRDLVSQGS